MNKTIIKNTNELVKENDRLFFLGDCTFGFNKVEVFKELWGAIKCRRIVFIRGNHNNFFDKPGVMPEIEKIVGKVFDIYEETIDGYPFWFCHYPYEEWVSYGGKRPKIKEKADQRPTEFPKVEIPVGKIICHGHRHCSIPDDPSALSIDVSFEGCAYNHKKYTPYSIPEIIHIMKTYKTPPLI